MKHYFIKCYITIAFDGFKDHDLDKDQDSDNSLLKSNSEKLDSEWET